MKYMGGKAKIASKLAEIIGSGDVLIEPFMGGGSMTAALAPSFNKVFAYDIHIDLVLMWQALLAGWEPPSNVSREEYYKLKFDTNSALRGFAGFACAFGGDWFQGYAYNTIRANYALEAKNLLRKKLRTMKNVVVDLEDYRNLVIPPGAVVYADPPYGGTQGFKTELNGGEFNSNEFWNIASGWATNGATVFVSESNAPGDWDLIWEMERSRGLRGKNDTPVVERLYCKG